MTDRPIHLDVSVPNFGAGMQPDGNGAQQGRPDADAGARDRFDQAMKPAAEKAAETQMPQAPFSLFAAPQAEAARAPRDAALTTRVGDSVERLMVGDGSSGNKQVRMELKDDILPGVSVTVQELDGRLQVDFFCSVESSRLRLNDAAPDQSRELAQRLARDVLVRVQTDDEEDPCLLEAAASP